MMHKTVKVSSYSFVAIFTVICLLASCKNKHDDNPISLADRKTVLNGIGYTVITPLLLELQTAVAGLRLGARSYTEDSTSVQKLLILQNQWLRAALSWKRVSPFVWGPIDHQFVETRVYTSIDQAAIEIAASKNGIAFDTSYVKSLSKEAKGLVAIEYLIFGTKPGQSDTVISAFLRKDQNRTAFLRALCDALQLEVNVMQERWSAGGGKYVENFVASDGEGRKSSLGFLTDNIVSHIKTVENKRLAIPMGQSTGDAPRPELVDGRYSGKSTQLLIAEIQAIEYFYTSKSETNGGSRGVSWLLDITDAKYGDQNLSDAVFSQLRKVYGSIAAIDIRLADAIQSKRSEVQILQNNVKNLEMLIDPETVKNLHFR